MKCKKLDNLSHEITSHLDYVRLKVARFLEYHTCRECIKESSSIQVNGRATSMSLWQLAATSLNV